MSQRQFVFFRRQWNASEIMPTEMVTLSAIQEESIRQMIDIDGRTWESVASIYQITVPQVREAHRRARAVAESRVGSMSEVWRESVVMMCLDVSSKAEECFQKSQKKKIKKVKKNTPQGMVYETHVETSNGDPRFLNTRLEAIKAIAHIQIPDEININNKVEHDFKVMLDMDDEKLESMASLARLQQQGVLAIDHKSDDVIDVPFSQAESPENHDAVPSGLPSEDAGGGEDSGDLRGDGLGGTEVPPEEG